MMICSKNINQAFFKISTTNNCKDMKKKSMPKEVISTLFFFTTYNDFKKNCHLEENYNIHVTII